MSQKSPYEMTDEELHALGLRRIASEDLREQDAYHEASHAVVAFLTGFAFEEVSIEIEERTTERRLVKGVTLAQVDPAIYIYGRPPKPWQRKIDRLAIAFAGDIGCFLCSQPPENIVYGGLGDEETVAKHAGVFFPNEQEREEIYNLARRRAARLLLENAPVIHHLAAALLEKETLTAAEAYRIIRRARRSAKRRLPPMDNTALTIVDSQSLDTETKSPDLIALAIGAWVHNKFQRSKSERTRTTYERTIKDFRAHLQALGLDLDSERLAIRDPLQVWAAQGAGESGATFNQRLAIVSSFYTFCHKQERLYRWEEEEIPIEGGQYLSHRRKVLVENPAEMIERAKVHPYASATALQPTEAEAVLESIDTSTPLGLRDYALLAVAFTTGRRLAELAALEWRDVKISRGKRQPETITLTWRHAKGGKRLADRLEPAVAEALLRYLRAAYGPALLSLPPTAPLWLAFDRAKVGSERQPTAHLTPRAIEYICERRLGQGKAHTMRYTFALGMKKAGASKDDIKERMAHESGDTTDKYLPQLERAENPFSAKVAALFGLQ